MQQQLFVSSSRLADIISLRFRFIFHFIISPLISFADAITILVLRPLQDIGFLDIFSPPYRYFHYFRFFFSADIFITPLFSLPLHFAIDALYYFYDIIFISPYFFFISRFITITFAASFFDIFAIYFLFSIAFRAYLFRYFRIFYFHWYHWYITRCHHFRDFSDISLHWELAISFTSLNASLPSHYFIRDFLWDFIIAGFQRLSFRGFISLIRYLTFRAAMPPLR